MLPFVTDHVAVEGRRTLEWTLQQTDPVSVQGGKEVLSTTVLGDHWEGVVEKKERASLSSNERSGLCHASELRCMHAPGERSGKRVGSATSRSSFPSHDRRLERYASLVEKKITDVMATEI